MICYKNYISDIYIHSDMENTRFVLGNSGSNILICLGINPNAAYKKFSDRTMNELICFKKGKLLQLYYDNLYLLLVCFKPDNLPA